MSLKLSKIDPKKSSNEGTVVDIKIDDVATGATIRVLGKFSDVAEKMQKAAVRHLAKEYKKTGKYIPPDIDDQKEQKIAYCVACTIGWDGIDGEDDQPLQFSPEAADKLYRKHEWILDQVDRAIGDEARFLTA